MEQRLFVVEGLDGSGKATQTALLAKSLEEKGYFCRQVTFPNYHSPSSALVKLYLGGAFGGSPASVNPYAAASFYAVDRFAGYHQDWKTDYEAGTIILADRYVTSNLIYQLSKVRPSERAAFVDWLQSYEYDQLGLPRPTATIYLDMLPSVSQKLLLHRYDGDEQKKDIHERDVAFLMQCRESALYSAKHCGWHQIRCDDGETPRSPEEIHKEIVTIVERYLQKEREGSKE